MPDWYWVTGLHKRKFFFVKVLQTRHSRKFMSTKCKDFALQADRESFCPRMFLPLK